MYSVTPQARLLRSWTFVWKPTKGVQEPWQPSFVLLTKMTTNNEYFEIIAKSENCKKHDW